MFVGAGDIGDCASDGARLTAEILDRIDGTVFTAGDNAYVYGTTDEYARCYDPYWGRHKARTRPSPGNHDYYTDEAAPYFAYYGERAGPAGRGYYSYTAGAWHVVSLNSNVDVSAGSAQLAWLAADLAASRTPCALAYWHHPRFSSGWHGDDTRFVALWRALEEAGVDVVITGHDHHYERFAAMTADGALDPLRGIRSFVVGTGGHGDLRPLVGVRPNSEVRFSEAWGVLKLTLHATRYDWEFVPVAGAIFSDAGAATCRG